MKAFVCLVMILCCSSTYMSALTIPSVSGPSLITKIPTRVGAITVPCLQISSSRVDQKGTIVNANRSLIESHNPTTSSDSGHKGAWRNPAGYLSHMGKTGTTGKHKAKTHKTKKHHKHQHCYSFSSRPSTHAHLF